jgi:small-conductance mechanosensitive channel
MTASMSEATTIAVVRITRAVIGASLGGLILGAIHAKLCNIERQHASFQPVTSTIVSATKPALVLLPYYCLARLLTVSSALVQVAAIKMRPEFEVLTRGHCDTVVFVFKRATQFLQDTSELVQIAFVAWTLQRLTSKLIKAIRLKILKEGDEGSTTLSRLMDGLSTVIKWVIWICAAFVALRAYGVDVQPLLASLGASSIILGIAAQSVLSNVIAAISFYTSPCFVPGDTIELLTQGGGLVVRGQVQVTTLARTIIKAEKDGALVYISNSDLSKMLVKNDSGKVTTLATGPVSRARDL